MFKVSIKLLCAANLFLLTILMIAGGQALSPRVIDLDKGEENIRILGDDAGDIFGCTAASGDINGDGYEDLIISAIYADDITGTVYVIFGGKSISSSIDLHSEPADDRRESIPGRVVRTRTQCPRIRAEALGHWISEFGCRDSSPSPTPAFPAPRVQTSSCDVRWGRIRLAPGGVPPYHTLYCCPS